MDENAPRYETLRYAQTGKVATITLARPSTLNALTAAMHADLRAALGRAEDDPAVRVVVLTGEGRAFSSGQDLTEDLPRGPDGALDRRALHCNEAELAAFFEEPAEDVPAAQPALVFA